MSSSNFGASTPKSPKNPEDVLIDPSTPNNSGTNKSSDKEIQLSPVGSRNSGSFLGSASAALGRALSGSSQVADEESSQTGTPNRSRWQRASAMVTVISYGLRRNKSSGSDSKDEVIPNIGIKYLNPLQSLLRDLCEATDFTFAEMWERPFKKGRSAVRGGGAVNKRGTRGSIFSGRGSVFSNANTSRRGSSASQSSDTDGSTPSAKRGNRRSSLIAAFGVGSGEPAEEDRSAKKNEMEDDLQPRLKFLGRHRFFHDEHAQGIQAGLKDNPKFESFVDSASNIKHERGDGIPGQTWKYNRICYFDLNDHEEDENSLCRTASGSETPYEKRKQEARSLFDLAVGIPVGDGVIRAVIVLYRARLEPLRPQDLVSVQSPVDEVRNNDHFVSIFQDSQKMGLSGLEFQDHSQDWDRSMEKCYADLQVPEDSEKLEINDFSDVLNFISVAITTYLGKFSGQGAQPAGGHPLSYCGWAFIGTLLSLLFLIGIDKLLQTEEYNSGNLFALIGSFGAVSTMLFAMPQSPLVQPRNVVGGHLISAVVAISLDYLTNEDYHPVIPQWIATGLAPALVAAISSWTGLTHPPAGATAVIFMIGDEEVKNLGWLFLIIPVLLDCTIMLIMALVINNMSRARVYPLYW